MEGSGLRPYAAALAVVASCAGGSPDDSGGVSLAEFVAGYCEIIRPCCADLALRDDGQKCREFFTTAASRGRWNPQGAATCLAAVQAAAAQPDHCAEVTRFPPRGCERMGMASAKPGGDCVVDADCAPSDEGAVRCLFTFDKEHLARKCQLQVRGGEGSAPCVGTDQRGLFIPAANDAGSKGFLCFWDDGLRCDPIAGRCVKLRAAGESCKRSYDCVSPLFCDAGVCAEQKPEGAACTPPDDLNLECTAGNYCDQNSRQCAARTAAGAACAQSTQCRSARCKNGACQGDREPTVGQLLLCGS
jgi:hypothetical protein